MPSDDVTPRSAASRAAKCARKRSTASAGTVMSAWSSAACQIVRSTGGSRRVSVRRPEAGGRFSAADTVATPWAVSPPRNATGTAS